MNILQFMADSPWLSFFLAYIILHCIGGVLYRFFRMISVALRGWPPAHLDADGDWKPEPIDD